MDKQYSCEILAEYHNKFAALEDGFFNVYGYYPMVDTDVFWKHNEVRKIECLMVLWFDLKDIFSKGLSSGYTYES